VLRSAGHCTHRGGFGAKVTRLFGCSVRQLTR
jgi:hypothetical protein